MRRTAYALGQPTDEVDRWIATTALHLDANLTFDVKVLNQAQMARPSTQLDLRYGTKPDLLVICRPNAADLGGFGRTGKHAKVAKPLLGGRVRTD